MKFTIITRYYHPTPDGIGHHSGYLNQHLIDAGHIVQVIYDDGIVSLQEKEIGILVNKIKRHRSDWVIFQYNGYSYNRFGAPNWLRGLFKKISHYTNAKLCLVVHETFIRPEESLKLKIYRYLQRRSLGISSKYAKLIVTTTHLYQQQLKDLGRKSEVLFTPSNFENYVKALKPPSPNKKLRIGTFGNRDPNFLLQIISGLEIKGLVCDFEFIGNYQPKYIKEIKSLTKKLLTIKITRSGKLTDSNIVQHLAKLDAFILLEPVRADGGGGLNTKSGASATALCMGIPIFSTKGDFTEEKVFEEGINYVLLNHENVEKSIDIIFSAINNMEKLTKIGLKGKELYEMSFAWKAYVEKMCFLMLKKESE
ncbi:MAG TPA: glycosyltransferase [Pelobium sp.]|nr:glycosyltransferase [Pelobium sp.]